MRRQRLLLVFGGRSVEHDISVKSAIEVVAAVDRGRFEPLLLGIRRDGGFVTLADATPAEVLERGHGVRDLTVLEPDVVLPLLHGPYGEDGRIQGFLETLSLPYVGSAVLASALCMSKATLKHLLSTGSQPTLVVPFIEVNAAALAGDDHERRLAAVASEVEARFGYPCFVKPDAQGSSLGTSRAHDRPSLLQGLRDALQLDRLVLVEPAVDAREIEVAILGTGGPDTIVSAPGEIVLPTGSWYDFESKYVSDVAKLAIPAALEPALAEQIRQIALSVFRRAGCYGLARIDFLLDRQSGAAYFNETNTMPGFTRNSMYPKLLAHAGVSYGELVGRLCDLALERQS
jgi:D-alanine--D-alanine ligase